MCLPLYPTKIAGDPDLHLDMRMENTDTDGLQLQLRFHLRYSETQRTKINVLPKIKTQLADVAFSLYKVEFPKRLK